MKPLDKGNEEEKEKEWSETIFVTDSELSKGRMSHKGKNKIEIHNCTRCLALQEDLCPWMFYCDTF